MSHWHNVWIEQGPAPWDDAMDWNFQSDLGNVTAEVNRGFDRGLALADWLQFVQATTTLGQIDLTDTQHTLQSVSGGVDAWITLDDTDNGTPSVQYASFTTPLEAGSDQRCGRAVFSDIHVSTGDDSTTSTEFPSEGCVTDIATLTPQEKVLAFMIFDIASCVGPVVD
jgi:hypothetical protein